jgi:hypothetical protein
MHRIIVALLLAFGSMISTASAYEARWYPLSDPPATEVERSAPKDIDCGTMCMRTTAMTKYLMLLGGV